MNTPKERFQQLSGQCGAFKKFVGTTEFLTACDYALLQLQQEMTPNTVVDRPTDPYIGIDANAQMQGAKRLIEILKNLHEPPPKPKPIKRDTLNYASPSTRSTTGGDSTATDQH